MCFVIISPRLHSEDLLRIMDISEDTDMKKINSNSYAGRVLLAGFGALATGFLLRLIPRIPVFVTVACAIIGAAILVSFSLLLLIEFRQDRRINREYAYLRTTKIRLSNGLYECQTCGNINVKEDDDTCRTCGNRFT